MATSSDDPRTAFVDHFGDCENGHEGEDAELAYADYGSARGSSLDRASRNVLLVQHAFAQLAYSEPRVLATCSYYAVGIVVGAVGDDMGFARSHHTGTIADVLVPAKGLVGYGWRLESPNPDQAKDRKVVGLVTRQIRARPDTAEMTLL